MRSVASLASLDGFRIDVEEPLLPRMQSIPQHNGSPDGCPNSGRACNNPDTRDGGIGRARFDTKSGLSHGNPATTDRVRDKKR